MVKKKLKKGLLLICILGTLITRAQTPANDKNWDITTPFLNEEFNGPSLNTSLWNVGLGWNDYGTVCSVPILSITYSGLTVTVNTNSINHVLQIGDKVHFAYVSGLTSNPAINGAVFTVTSFTTIPPYKFTFSVSSISGVHIANTGCLTWDNTFTDASSVYTDGSSHLILQSDYNPTRPDNITIHSGAITSKLKNFAYGYYEIKCKLNSFGYRYMPAFWVWGGSDYPIPCGDPNNWYNENDFFEAYQEYSGSTDFNLTNNLHWRKYNICTDNNGTIVFSDNRNPGIDLYNTFHTYGYEWTPQRIIYYLDGVPYRIVNSQYVGDHPGLFLTVDLGIRGPWTPAPTGLGTNGPDYKNYMILDYIKVYNLKKNCTPQTILNYNSGVFTDYSLRQSISIGGTSNVIAGAKVTFRAQDGILINGDFTAPTGSELTLLPTNCY